MQLIEEDNWTELPQPIGLLGGSFDPVQNAHVEMARTVLASGHVRSVVFIPAQQNPLKASSPLASMSDRMQMLQRALQNEAGCAVSQIEATLPVPSYTFDTVAKIRSLLGTDAKLFFVGGSDLLPDFHRWHKVHELMRLLNGFLVFSRRESAPDEVAKLSNHFNKEELKLFYPLELGSEYKEISATQFRDFIEHENKIKHLVPQTVLAYVREKKLYR